MEVLNTQYYNYFLSLPTIILVIFFIAYIALLIIAVLSVLALIKEMRESYMCIIVFTIMTIGLIFLGGKTSPYVKHKEVIIKEDYKFDIDFVTNWEIGEKSGKIYTVRPRGRLTDEDWKWEN